MTLLAKSRSGLPVRQGRPRLLNPLLRPWEVDLADLPTMTDQQP